MYKLETRFCSVVCGLADTLVIFKTDIKLKADKPSLQQTDLAKKYVPGWKEDEGNEALQDCKTLEIIVNTLKYADKFITLCIATDKFIGKKLDKGKSEKKKSTIDKELEPLITVLSKGMVTKLTENGITMSILEEQYNIGQGNSIHVLLAQDAGNGKPRVTNSKSIAKKLCSYLQKRLDSSNNNI